MKKMVARKGESLTLLRASTYQKNGRACRITAEETPFRTTAAPAPGAAYHSRAFHKGFMVKKKNTSI